MTLPPAADRLRAEEPPGVPTGDEERLQPRPSGELRTFLRSNVASLFTTALDFGTLVGLTELAHVGYVLSTWIGTVVGSLANFLVNKLWTFEARRAPYGRQLTRFVLVQIGASAWHTAGVWALTSLAGLRYPLSKGIMAVVVYLLWNYPLNRRFVFSRTRAVSEPERSARGH